MFVKWDCFMLSGVIASFNYAANVQSCDFDRAWQAPQYANNHARGVPDKILYQHDVFFISYFQNEESLKKEPCIILELFLTPFK